MSTVRFRHPMPSDSSAIFHLAVATAALDNNSWYYYALFARDFAETSMVAEVDGDIVGFVTGYTRPSEPRTLFLWQTATTLTHGVPNLGLKLLEKLVDEAREQFGITYVEATTDPQNKAIEMQFRLLARTFNVESEKSILFDVADFEELDHPEQLVRMGPLT